MKHPLKETIAIPEGINCSVAHHVLTCNKDGVSVKRYLHHPGLHITVENSSIILSVEKGNKNSYKVLKTLIAHIKNLFDGVTKPYTYVLEACNVHFPMTLKKDGDWLIISNFLGEKVPRKAKIFPGVNIEIKGLKITLTSADKDSAGHTAAAIEKATKIRNRDRRIFQDGIYLVERPGGTA